MGLTPAPLPRFVKPYADLAGPILSALENYISEVRAGTFPEARHTYSMPDEERELFESGGGAPDGRSAKSRD
jgi:3-methyl-2-oxobutanoate hydroxymethyltransferase